MNFPIQISLPQSCFQIKGLSGGDKIKQEQKCVLREMNDDIKTEGDNRNSKRDLENGPSAFAVWSHFVTCELDRRSTSSAAHPTTPAEQSHFLAIEFCCDALCRFRNRIDLQHLVLRISTGSYEELRHPNSFCV